MWAQWPGDHDLCISESECHNHFSQSFKSILPTRKKQVFLRSRGQLFLLLSLAHTSGTLPIEGGPLLDPMGRARYLHQGSDPRHTPECSQEEFSLKPHKSTYKCQTAQITLLLPRTHWSASSDRLISQWELFLLNTLPCQPHQVPWLPPMQSSNCTRTYWKGREKHPFKLLLSNKSPRLINCIHQYKTLEWVRPYQFTSDMYSKPLQYPKSLIFERLVWVKCM